MASFVEWSEKQQPITPIEAHWFNPILQNTDSGLLVYDPYTTNYNKGSSPWVVTLTSNLIDSSGKVSSTEVPIASYTTGFNFHIEESSLATSGETAIVYDTADASDPSTGVDIDVRTVDASGHPVGAAKTLFSNVGDVEQFRVASVASGGTTYDVTYATVDKQAGEETIHYQVFNQDGTAVSQESGTLMTFNTVNGEGYGFATLVPSTQADPSYILIRASALGQGGDNFALKYELVGVNGAATTSTRVIEPDYLSGSTAKDLTDFDFTRLDPTTSDGPNLAVVSRYTYDDSNGVEHEALDVRTMNAVTQEVSDDITIPVAVGSTGETMTRLADGGFVLGYGDGASNPSVLQEFDANGHEVGSAFSLPANETHFNIAQLADGRLLVEFPQAETGGNQLDYDIYSIAPACYCRGTRIRTAFGETVVEDLSIGDGLITASGAVRPIKWIGRRSYAGRFANANPHLLPVCFKAGSLGQAIPSRDLWVSPKHAMFLDGVLVPAEHLVNTRSVVQPEQVDSVDYFHIELDSHDVILAEGALSETFVDDGSRGMFRNAHEFAALYPDTARTEALYCAPRVEDGFALEAVRRRIATRARLPSEPGSSAGPLRGFVERASDGRVCGWAQNERFPDAPVCLEVLADGFVVAVVLATNFRSDLLAAGIGDGRHAFAVDLSAIAWPLRDRALTVRRQADGKLLPSLLQTKVGQVAA